MAKSVECKACGNIFSSDEPKCPYCGAVNLDIEVTQPNSTYQQAQQSKPAYQQAQQPKPVYQQAPKAKPVYQQAQQPQPNLLHPNIVEKRGPFNKYVTIFLCLIGGCAGIHKFYEGKIGLGILYMMTCGLLFVGVIYDLFKLFGESDQYYV